MPSTVKHDPALDIIEVTLTGLTTEAEHRENIAQVISRQKQTGMTRSLLDASRWEGGISLTVVYEVVYKQYWKEELNVQSRIAIIVPTSVNALEAARFYETVCYNRGLKAKVCPDRQSAIDWLLGKTNP